MLDHNPGNNSVALLRAERTPISDRNQGSRGWHLSLIFLPTLRVVLMLSAFARARDLLFSGISMLVLVIIVLGAVLGAA